MESNAAYAEAHGLYEQLTAAVSAVMVERPVDPIARICEILQPPATPAATGVAMAATLMDYMQPSRWFVCPPLGVEGTLATTVPRVEDSGMGQTAMHSPVVASSQAAADCFFLHGTIVEYSGQPNVDSSTVVPPGSRMLTEQISAFSHVARCFAPYYRFVSFSGGHAGAFDVAFDDVAAAFEAFLSWSTDERPLIIAAHSQGSIHTMELLKRFFDGDDDRAVRLRARLAGCYAPGTWVSPTELPKHVPICSYPGHVGSVALWMCATHQADLTETLIGKVVGPYKGAAPVVVNPLTWSSTLTGDGEPAVAADHLGALSSLPDGTYALLLDVCDVVTARGGLLRLGRGVEAPRVPSILTFDHGDGSDYHVFDLHLMWANVRKQVQLQVENWLGQK